MNYDDLLRELKMEAVSFPDISAEDLADIIHALEKHFCNATKDAVPVRHGHWIENDTTYAEMTRQTCTCSVCGRHSPRPLGEFCRWCGAKMDEEGKDLVDEQPTVDVESIIAKHEDIGYEKGFRDGYAEALEVTDDAKRNGHWILQTNGHGMCSTCGTFVDLLNGMTWEYCPNCGAKMNEEKEDG